MRRYKTSMVAEHGSDPQDRVSSSAGVDGHRTSTLQPVSTFRPWRYQTIARRVYSPGGKLPPPPLSTGAHDASPVAGFALPSTPQGTANTFADEIVEQVVTSTSLSEPVASVASAVIKGAPAPAGQHHRYTTPQGDDSLTIAIIAGAPAPAGRRIRHYR